MDQQHKISGGNYVNDMAELGQKHSRLFAETLKQVAKEYKEFMDRKEHKDIHPIFQMAGRGAYAGALKFDFQPDQEKFEEMLSRDIE